MMCIEPNKAIAPLITSIIIADAGTEMRPRGALKAANRSRTYPPKLRTFAHKSSASLPEQL
jgi:hypothetical protein